MSYDAFRVALGTSYCIACRRRVSLCDQRARDLVLAKSDWCSWCAQPRSARARQLIERVNASTAVDLTEACAVRH